MSQSAGLRVGVGRAWRWLLELDRPVSPRTEIEIAAEVERNYRWNFGANLMDAALFWCGASFISSSTIIPFYISKLTASPLPIGVAAMISQGGWYLPQLFTAPAVQRLARKKAVVVKLGFFMERLPLGVMLLSAIFAARSPGLALALFLCGSAWHSLGAGVVATSWQDLIARCFPVERRGRFFGTAMFVGAGTSAIGAAISTQILQDFGFPNNFIVLFSLAATCMMLSWIALAQTREPVQPANAQRQSQRQFLASLPGVLGRDPNFRRFLVARLLLALGAMGWGFVTVSVTRRWSIPDSMVGLFTIALLVGQTIGNLSFGFLADRFGHKLSLEIGALAGFLAFGLAWLAPAPAWYLGAFALMGINSSAILISGILMVLEVSRPDLRPTYVGLGNTAVGLVSILGPMIGAWLATAGYGWLFALTAAVNLAAWIAMRWTVREPRWAT